MISPVKAIIFDADGVLLDSLSIWRELGKRYITDLGYHPIAGMEEILFPMSMEQGAAWLKSRFALGFSEEKIVEDLKVRIQNYYFEEVPAKSGARELFQYLASQKIPGCGGNFKPKRTYPPGTKAKRTSSFFKRNLYHQ